MSPGRELSLLRLCSWMELLSRSHMKIRAVGFSRVFVCVCTRRRVCTAVDDRRDERNILIWTGKQHNSGNNLARWVSLLWNFDEYGRESLFAFEKISKIFQNNKRKTRSKIIYHIFTSNIHTHTHKHTRISYILLYTTKNTKDVRENTHTYIHTQFTQSTINFKRSKQQQYLQFTHHLLCKFQTDHAPLLTTYIL